MKKKIRVLLFDDDVMTLRIQYLILSRHGYQVFTCETAVDIFATLEKYAPDIILMDHDMPEVSGIDAIKQLKSNERTKAIPIVYFTYYQNCAAEAKEAGAAAYVSKSSHFDDLAHCIGSLVNDTTKGVT